MAKEKDIDNGEMKFDDNLNFDFEDGGFDLDDPAKSATKRSPVMSVVKGVGKGAKSNLTSRSFWHKIAKKALPETYTTVTDELSKSKEVLSESFRQSVKLLRPEIMKIGRDVNKLVPAEAKRLKGFTSRFEEEKRSSSPSQESNEANLILQAQSEIFGKMQEQSIQQEARSNAEDRVRDKIDSKRFQAQSNLMSGIFEATQKTASYTTTINASFQKKSLELQYRSYFVQAELLKQATKYNELFKTQLEAIGVNTGLPDFVKINKTEQFKQLTQNKLFDKISDKLSGATSRMTKRLMGYVHTAKDSLSGVQTGLEMGLMAKEMLDSAKESGMEVDYFEEGGDIAGKFVSGKIAEIVGNKVKGKLDSNGKVFNFLAMMSRYVTDPNQLITVIQKSKFFKDGLDNMGIKGNVFSAVNDILNAGKVPGMQMKYADGQSAGSIKPHFFSDRAHKSLTEIIPGYLARILRETTSIRSGLGFKAGELELFDHRNGRFKGENETKANIIEGMKSSIGTSHDYELDQLTALTTGKARKGKNNQEIKKFLDDFFKDQSVDLSSLEAVLEHPKLKALRPKFRVLIEAQLKQLFSSEVKRELLTKAVTKYRETKRSQIERSRDFVGNFTREGNVQQLLDLGLVKETSDGGYELNADAVSDYSSDAITEKGTKTEISKATFIRMAGLKQADGTDRYDGEIEGMKYDREKKKYVSISDRNKKKDIKQNKGKNTAINKLNNLNTYSYNYTAAYGGGQHEGYMAQDVKREFGNQAAPNGTTIDMSYMTSVNSAAIQDLHKQISDSLKGSKTETTLEKMDSKLAELVMLSKIAMGGIPVAEMKAMFGEGYESAKQFISQLEIADKIDSVKNKAVNIGMRARTTVSGKLQELNVNENVDYVQQAVNEKLLIMLERFNGMNISENADYIKNGVIDKSKIVSEYMNERKEHIMSSLKDIKNGLWKRVKKAGSDLKKGADSLVDRHGDKVLEAGNTMIGMGLNSVNWVLNQTNKTIGQRLPNAFEWMKDTLGKVRTKIKDRLDKPVDLYLPGQNSPILVGEQFEMGMYIDDSGKEIRTISDLKKLTGNIRNKQGNIIVSENDLKKGLIDKHGNKLSNMITSRKDLVSGLIGSVANIAITGVSKIKNTAMALFQKSDPNIAKGLVRSIFGGAKNWLLSATPEQKTLIKILGILDRWNEDGLPNRRRKRPNGKKDLTSTVAEASGVTQSPSQDTAVTTNQPEGDSGGSFSGSTGSLGDTYNGAKDAITGGIDAAKAGITGIMDARSAYKESRKERKRRNKEREENFVGPKKPGRFKRGWYATRGYLSDSWDAASAALQARKANQQQATPEGETSDPNPTSSGSTNSESTQSANSANKSGLFYKIRNVRQSIMDKYTSQGARKGDAFARLEALNAADAEKKKVEATQAGTDTKQSKGALAMIGAAFAALKTGMGGVFNQAKKGEEESQSALDKATEITEQLTEAKDKYEEISEELQSAKETLSEGANDSEEKPASRTSSTPPPTNPDGTPSKKRGRIRRTGRWLLDRGKAGVNIARTAGNAAAVARTGQMLATGARVAGIASAAAGTLMGGEMGMLLAGSGGLMSMAAPLLTNPVALGLLAIGGTVYGGYSLYKYLTKNSTTKSQKIRCMQYGFGTGDGSSHNGKMIALENYLDDGRVTKSGDNIPMLDGSKINMTHLYELMEIDPGNQKATQAFQDWMQSRFKPFYLNHLAALWKVSENAKSKDADDLDGEDKIKYYKALRFDNGPYNYIYSPIIELDKLNSNQIEVFKACDEIIKSTRPETKVKPGQIPRAGADKPIDVKKDTINEFNRVTKQGKIDVANNAAQIPDLSPSGLINRSGKAQLGVANLSASALIAANQRALYEKDSASAGVGKVRLPTNNVVSGILGRAGIPVMASGDLMEGTSGMNHLVYGKKGVNMLGLNPQVRKNFLGMVEEYYKLTGKSIQVNSAYRSTKEQAEEYARNPNEAAKPGASPHEFGFALDIQSNQADELDKLGLMKKYGFTRPLSGEPWHIEPSVVQLDIPRAKRDPAYLTQAALESLGRGGGGIGSLTPKGVRVGRNMAIAQKVIEAPVTPTLSPAQSNTPDIVGAGSVLSVSSKKVIPKVRDYELDTLTITGTRKKITPPSVSGPASNAGSYTINGQLSLAEVDSSSSKKGGVSNTAGVNDLLKTIDMAAKEVGVDPDLMKAFAAVESDLDPNSGMGGKGAKGLFQFTDSTWAEQLNKFKGKYGLDKDTLPSDPRANSLLAAEYLKANLSRLGVPNPGPIEAYLTHFLGLEGAKLFLSSNPAALGKDIFPEAAAKKGNRSIFFSNGSALTIGQIYNNIKKKISDKARYYGITPPGGKLPTPITAGVRATSPESPQDITQPVVAMRVNYTPPPALQAPTAVSRASNAPRVDIGQAPMSEFIRITKDGINIQQKSLDTLIDIKNLVTELVNSRMNVNNAVTPPAPRPVERTRPPLTITRDRSSERVF